MGPFSVGPGFLSPGCGLGFGGGDPPECGYLSAGPHGGVQAMVINETADGIALWNFVEVWIGLVIGFIDAAITDPTSSTWSLSKVGDNGSLSANPREGVKEMPLPPSGFSDLFTLPTMMTEETGLVAMGSESPNPVLPVPSGCFLEMIKDFGYGPNWVWCRRHVLVSPVTGKLSEMFLLSI